MACGGLKTGEIVHVTNDVRTQRSAPGSLALEKIAFYLGSVSFGALLVSYKMLAHCWLTLLLLRLCSCSGRRTVSTQEYLRKTTSFLPRYRWIRRQASMVVLREDPPVFCSVQSGVRASTSDGGKGLANIHD